MFRSKSIAAAVLAAGLAAMAPSLAMAGVTAPSATFGLYPASSTNGVAPTHAHPDIFYVYSYTMPSGAALSDTIPFLVCLDGSTLGTDRSGNPVPWSDQVTAGPNGAFSADVAVAGAGPGIPPWSFNSSDPTIASSPPSSSDPACQSGTVSINIPANTLTGSPGTGFVTFVTFSTQSSDPTNLKDSFDTPPGNGTPLVKIKLFVQIAAADPLICYMTDSNGDFLLQSDGITPANKSGDTSGLFRIVENKKGIAVATNPGQFYYNLLWQNPGAQTSVTITLADNNLLPNGTQAIHWALFNTTGFGGVTPADFDAVIEANPAGTTATSSNPLTVTVPAGQTLYVTQHLAWSGLGHPAPSSPVMISVTGTTTPAAGSSGSCTAGATGSLQ